jgi:uncharacterized surface protein with fasciclin (FAS1) repeats
LLIGNNSIINFKKNKMKKNKLFNSAFIGALALFIATGFSACKKDENVKPTIAQIAVNINGFSQLEAAAIRGGVVGLLSNKNPEATSGGNFTVFAPTNQAFAKLGLVNPEDLNALQQSFLFTVLAYHVNNGLKIETDFTNGASLPSLLGATVTKRIITRNNGKDLFVNGSKIISTNVTAENGVVHAIDKVLLASGANIANTAIFFSQGKGFVKPELSFLVEAVVYCDLVNALADPAANYTVFAPTNQAFKDLGKILGVSIENPSDIRKLPKATVTQVLLTHVFNLPGGGKFTSELNAGTITSLNSKPVTFGAYTDGVLTVKGSGNAVAANMVIPDVQTTNGVVHVIDRVLLP